MVCGRVLLTATTIDDIARETHTWGHPGGRAAAVAAGLVQDLLDAIDQEVVPRDSRGANTGPCQTQADQHGRRLRYPSRTSHDLTRRGAMAAWTVEKALIFSAALQA
jgi:hypothetical protein